jgi:uncharacterized SAM-dependent methyltransferase
VNKKPKITEIQKFNSGTLKEKLQEPRKVVRTFYFDKSETWYLDDKQVDDYKSLYDGGDYTKGMLLPEKELIEHEIMLTMDRIMPAEFTFLDLGPGTADKSKILLAHAIKHCPWTRVNYVAIDISKKMLSSALVNIAELGIPVQGYIADFATDALKHIRISVAGGNLVENNEIRPAFIYLGPTFMNYEPDFILNHMSKAMYNEDRIYLSAQKTYDIEEIVKQYSGAGYLDMTRPMIRAMKINDEEINFKTDIKARFNRGAIECYMVAKKDSELKKRGILPGDEIVFITSRKYDAGSFKEHLWPYFEGEHLGGSFFQNEKFITYVGKKK